MEASTNENDDGLDNATRVMLEELPLPKVPNKRAGKTSIYMEQMILLQQMDPRRLMDEPDPDIKGDCYTHACKHCNDPIKILWKSNNSTKQNDGGSYSTNYAKRHLKNNCNEEGKASIQEATKVKEEKDVQQAKEKANKQDLFHKEKGAEDIVKKRKKSHPNYTQQKLPNALTYQERAWSSMANFFVYSSSYPAFDIFRDQPFLLMLRTIAGENELKMLTIPHLKKYIQAEWDTFKKYLKQELKDHHIEAKGSPFCQFINDGTTLKNKHKYQAFGMQFPDRRFRCNHVVALSFRKVLSSKAETVKELAEDVSLELTEKQFKEIFSSSVQDQAAKKVAEVLEVATDTCDMHQGDKIGASAVGELTRSRGGVVINAFPEGLEIIQLLRDMVKHFESNPTNRKNYDSVLQDHLYLPRNAFKRDLNGTRISSVYNLIRSCLRLKRAVIEYCNKFGLPPFLTEVQWQVAAEMEAILHDKVTVLPRSKK